LDSLTHIVLGAAIGDKVLGKKIGRKAAWIGALAKTFPDFDLLYSGLSDPRKYVLYHRSYTHSFFVELLTAFPMAFFFYLLFKKKIAYREWFLLWVICLWGHSLVDIFTNYGTRIFLPFSKQLVSLNNIAIADLFLTIPILIMVVVALLYKNNSIHRSRWMNATLLYAIAYFSMTFVNKAIADKHFKQSIQANQISSKGYMSNPTILNNLLWYSLVNTDSSLLVGEYSLLQHSDTIQWRSYPIQKNLLLNHPSEDARMLEWFSQGFYFTQLNKDTLEVFIPKFGRGDLDKTIANETFLFYYQIYYANGMWKFGAHQPNSKEMKFGEAFRQLYEHIIDKKK
jgi:inner membrane protein